MVKKPNPKVDNIANDVSLFKISDVVLTNSHFFPFPEDGLPNDVPADFLKTSMFFSSITWIIKKTILESSLEVRIIEVTSKDTEKLSAMLLDFTITAIISVGPDVEHNRSQCFLRDSTLEILWPYAQEYSNDVFRRYGLNVRPLPIINGKAYIEHLEKTKSIEIIIE